MRNKILILIGPTAVGKTNLSIALAQKYQGEIISGDSVQVYQQFNIGSAKIKPEEMKGIPHHLIDIISGNTSYSVADFQQQAKQCIDDIQQRQHLPMIVGGTGLYIQSIINNYQLETVIPDKILQQVYTILNDTSASYVHHLLSQVDNVSAQKIHPNNIKRLVRAYAYYLHFNRRISDNIQSMPNTNYDILILGLTAERALLYQRINHRVELMFKQGLVSEVQSLLAQGIKKESQAMRAIGYKEVVSYLEGCMDLEQCQTLIQRNTRRFAKRQLTWFNNKMSVQWIDIHQDAQNVYQQACDYIDHWLK